MKDLNEKDIAENVELLKEINMKRGNSTSKINIAMDGRYNSVSIASRRGTWATKLIRALVHNCRHLLFGLA